MLNESWQPAPGGGIRCFYIAIAQARLTFASGRETRYGI
jgi:hypothetical protein